MEKKKTNLFVVGAMKAGTTSFMDQLSGHPEVYMPPIKEPHFFINGIPSNLYEPSRFFDLEHYFEKDFPKPLHICKVETTGQYERLFSLSADQKYRTDGSTTYLHSIESAGLIHHYNPEARVIIIVRNPVERAFSHYQMDLGKGREKRSFEMAIAGETDLYNNAVLPWNSYLGMSFYDQVIKRFKALFDDVLVLKFEDWITHPEKTMKTVSGFLGVSLFNIKKASHKNISKPLRFQKLFYFLKQLGLKDYFSKIFRSNFRQWLFQKFSKEEKLEMKLSEETSSKLKAIFSKESGQCYY